MRRFVEAISLLAMLCVPGPCGFAQLRYDSDYSVDRVNTEQTSFLLKDSGAAEYHCASEWTTLTVQTNLTRTVFFIWHFKDGTKGFARQVEYVGDIGVRTEFLMTHSFADLEDQKGKKIQPMTRDNYPESVEIWLGEYEAASGYTPEILIDKVCLDAQTIEFNLPYHFKSCP
ncbi:MAG: hypothetical protein QUT30_07875 [Acidobacteriota bacterium]|nr:hypothetical protein [Acidobacteriota bacterium]